jgi:hypothetical protein
VNPKSVEADELVTCLESHGALLSW